MSQVEKRERCLSADMPRMTKAQKLEGSPSSIAHLSTMASPAKCPHAHVLERVAPEDRDAIVAGIFTISLALGLEQETLHIFTSLLDRYLSIRPVELRSLEKVAIACFWIAIKFEESANTIAEKHVKSILQSRGTSGKWTWHEILELELEILKTLDFRVFIPTVLSRLHTRIDKSSTQISAAKISLMQYLSDLVILRSEASIYSEKMLVDAIWSILQDDSMASTSREMLAPIFSFFLFHRDVVDGQHDLFDKWAALRCRYGRVLPFSWELPYAQECSCRVCNYNRE